LAVAAVAAAHGGPGQNHGHRGGHYYRANGWVTAAPSATTLTVRDAAARSESFALTSSTAYRYANGATADAADVTVNEIVSVTATAPTTSGGNPVAQNVVIQLATLVGMVKSDSSGTLTVIDDEGFTRTVKTSSSTTCVTGKTKVACSAIAAGSVVQARGSVASDGTTLDASRISAIAPTS
jgi:hypothetical protein